MTAAIHTWTATIVAHAALVAVATTSFAIYGPGGYSWIHGLSVFTLLMLTTGVMHARLHNLSSHRTHMISLCVCALITAGLFTLFPGRLMGNARACFQGKGESRVAMKSCSDSTDNPESSAKILCVARRASWLNLGLKARPSSCQRRANVAAAVSGDIP